MNERIKELLNQAGIYQPDRFDAIDGSNQMEKFAELIVQECKENFAKVWYEQGMDIRGAELDKFLTRFEEHLGVEE
jgi:hypothetical protein